MIHSRAPWIVVEEDDRTIIGCDDFLGRHIAYLSNGGVPEDEEKANGLLIAAAPDMLRILKEIAGNGDGTGRNPQLMVNAAVEAIAKAEGKS